MKTQKLLRILLILLAIGSTSLLYAQDVSLNITPQQSSILKGEIGEVEVKICNEDPEPITAPANKLRPLISFSENLTIMEVVNPDGSPLTDFSVISILNDPGEHTAILEYTGELVNATCAAFHVRFAGNTVGQGFMTATLSFEGPQTVGNDPGNDNSTTTTMVEINLPVKLQDFKVTKEGTSAQLSWITSEEVNSERFDVQKSSDGKNWKTFETVQALGESRDSYTYHAVDKAPFSGENLYRLHMIDKDGTSAYSSIRYIKFEGIPMSLYPNPVSDELILDIPNMASVSSIKMFDLNGKVVYNSGASPEKTINVRHLNAGAYVVRIKGVNGAETSSKILVVK
ncbi:T9SS type A sorting domain-containing protein [Dyadobacter crusticola]|uniref:T9SS type A sorting domain-containing protein n=1 Tax=Dyadobacter crusticola TaxID=292407 RepID=UPI00068CF1F1|nr:T9SS type A sorting domain-containing protein [Dyadobacter crusticola]